MVVCYHSQIVSRGFPKLNVPFFLSSFVSQCLDPLSAFLMIQLSLFSTSNLNEVLRCSVGHSFFVEENCWKIRSFENSHDLFHR